MDMRGETYRQLELKQYIWKVTELRYTEFQVYRIESYSDEYFWGPDGKTEIKNINKVSKNSMMVR